MAYEDGVFATFYDDAIKNDFKTKKEGRPVFDEVLMLKVQVPNQLDCVPRPAQEADKQRFPKSWQAYVTGKEPADEGFPLEHWPQMTTADVKLCRANHIKTVEQLSEVNDATLHRLGPSGSMLKNRAKKFLDSLTERDSLRQQNKDLQKRLDELQQKIEAMENAQPKKRKRIAG